MDREALRADLRGPCDTLRREFVRVRILAIAAAGLTVAATVCLGIAALTGG